MIVGGNSWVERGFKFLLGTPEGKRERNAPKDKGFDIKWKTEALNVLSVEFKVDVNSWREQSSPQLH